MPGGSGSRGGRLLIGLASVAFAISLGLPSAGIAVVRADPVLAVVYIGSTSLQVTGPAGAVRSGGTLPAGAYQLQVDDPDFTNPKFQITGPGLNVSDDLNSTGMGIDRPAFLGPYTFQANASYRIQDANMGASSAVTFTTISGGSTSGGSTSGGSSTSSGGSSGSTSSGGTSSSSLGTLAGSIGASGKPALTFGGKTVKTLKAGLYKVTVADHSKKAGLIIQKLGFHAMTFSGGATVGTASHSLTLSTGKWFFAASTGGQKTYFSVTS